MKSLSLLMLRVLFTVYKSDLPSSHNITVFANCSNSRFDLHVSNRELHFGLPIVVSKENEIGCRKIIRQEYW